MIAHVVSWKGTEHLEATLVVLLNSVERLLAGAGRKVEKVIFRVLMRDASSVTFFIATIITSIIIVIILLVSYLFLLKS